MGVLMCKGETWQVSQLQDLFAFLAASPFNPAALQVF